MAEDVDCLKNKKMGEQKDSVTAIGNSWIICRSQSHSGRIYYFNTLTGKSAWNLSDGEIAKAQLVSREAASVSHVGDCPEPLESPVDSPHSSSHQHIQPKDAGSRIYNKQIINNQFSKPYGIPAFQNNHCPCSSLTTVNDPNLNVAPVYNPAVWVIPPPHQVFLASPAGLLANQTQPAFNTPNMHADSVPNYFQMEQNSPRFQAFPRTNKYPARWNQNTQRNYQSTTKNDLRDILSARRKDHRSCLEEPERRQSYESQGNNLLGECEKPKITTDDLDPSDIDDEWFEANTIGNISRAWRECSGADCWIVVANAHVMLNNRKFLSTFIKPEEQIYLLTPLEVLKLLRSVIGAADSGSRRVKRARCALRLAAQQMDKVPAGVKNLQNRTVEKCCLELIEQNYHVLLLLDENALSSHINIDGVSTFTINKLKHYLNQKFSTWKLGPHESITVTFSHKDGENINKINQSTQEAPTPTQTHNTEYKNELTSIEHKEIEIQTEQIPPSPVKTTMDACIQTDFDVPQSAQILQSPISEVLKSPVVAQPLNTVITKSPCLGVSSQIGEALKMDVVVESSNDDKEESKIATKKIKLNRQTFNASTGHSNVKKSQFRWRKQRAKPSMTTTSSPKGGVASNNQTLPSKSPPSSLISISDLLPPQNDNFSDLAKSIAFSDASIDKTHAVESKVIDESSLDVISNSIDEPIHEISKNAIFNESKDSEKEDILMYEVTSDLMDDYLSRGCDEWVSRFVQIMEEALSQILQQDFDPDMPPPWSFYEATVCIKRKFMDNSKIVFACHECGTFLLKISDSRGKIFADLNPSDFMRLYSYGVYLIEALQFLLSESEDLQIAKESLTKLLDDIKNPNLDVGQNVFIDAFLPEKQGHIANVSELDADAGDERVDATITSPPKKLKQTSPCLLSPLKYNLRSSQRSNELNGNELPADQNMNQNTNTDESFFNSLRLQKTSSSTDIHLPSDTRPFTPQENSLSNHSSRSIKEATKENQMKGPKIIRNFNFDPDIEKKLKNSDPLLSSTASNAYDFEYDDYADDNNHYGNEFIIEDTYNNNSDDKSVSNTHYETQEQYTKSDEIGAQILKFVVERTTYPVHSVLEDLHSFCEDTSKELSSRGKIDKLYKINLIEKTKEVSESVKKLCDNLNSVLGRKDTKTKVRLMLEELGFMSYDIDDTQVAEYEGLLQKYLDQATILFQSVNLIAAVIKEKE